MAQSAGANATRRELIQQASEARAAGNHTLAIDLAQRASQIRMSVSLRMFLAEEQAAAGQLTAALDNADTCTREVRTEAGVTDRDSVATHCQTLVDALNHRVGRVVVRVPGNPQGVQVHVGADALAPALWNIAYVVNPGTLAVDAAGPGGATFHRELTIAEGATETVDVLLTQPVAAAPITRVETPHATTPVDRGPSPLLRSPVGSYVVMGVGGATLVASVVFWVLRAQAFSGCSWDSSSVGYCDTAAQTQHAMNEGQTYNVVAPVTLAAGGVIAAGGVVWWLMVRRHEAAESAAHRTAWWVAPGATGASIGVAGSF